MSILRLWNNSSFFIGPPNHYITCIHILIPMSCSYLAVTRKVPYNITSAKLADFIVELLLRLLFCIVIEKLCLKSKLVVVAYVNSHYIPLFVPSLRECSPPKSHFPNFPKLLK